MSYLVTVANTALCSHGGKASPTLPNMRVRAGGQPTVTQPPPYLVVGCPYVTPAGAALLPCVSAAWLTGSLRVRSTGQPVVLADSEGITVPNGVPAHILPAQMRVRGR